MSADENGCGRKYAFTTYTYAMMGTVTLPASSCHPVTRSTGSMTSVTVSRRSITGRRTEASTTESHTTMTKMETWLKSVIRMVIPLRCAMMWWTGWCQGTKAVGQQGWPTIWTESWFPGSIRMSCRHAAIKISTVKHTNRVYTKKYIKNTPFERKNLCKISQLGSMLKKWRKYPGFWEKRGILMRFFNIDPIRYFLACILMQNGVFSCIFIL